jgi:hypothetical protein
MQFRCGDNGRYYILEFPHWFATVVVAGLGALPWFRWRFSLRALLIAITLVAAGLGLFVYAASN